MPIHPQQMGLNPGDYVAPWGSGHFIPTDGYGALTRPPLDIGDALRGVHADVIVASYYVDPVSGNDTTGTGTSGNPWQTFDGAVANLRTGSAGAPASWASSGDVVLYLKAGTYQATAAAQQTVEITFNNAARAPKWDRWFLVRPAPGVSRSQVVVKPPAGATGSKYAIKTYHTGSAWLGAYVQVRDLTIDGESTRKGNADCVGVYVNQTPDFEIVGVEIKGLQAGDTAGVSSKAQGIYAEATSQRLKVVNSLLHDIGTTTGTINAQEHGIYYGGHDCLIDGNIVYNCPNGFGVQEYNSGNPVNGADIVNNTVWGTIEKSCLILSGNGAGHRVHNNILGGATEYGVEFIPATAGTGNVWSHNIVYNNTAGARSASPAGWLFGADITTNPLLTNPPTSFVPGAGSPALNAASLVWSRSIDQSGTTRSPTPDIGALEFVSSGVTETPTPGGAIAGGQLTSAQVQSGAGGGQGAGALGGARVAATTGAAVGGGTAPAETSNVVETVTAGGGAGGGISPTARAATPAGAAAGAGTFPTARAAVPAGGGVGAGTGPAASAGAAAGAATGGGTSPTTTATPPPGGSTGAGVTPAARAAAPVGAALAAGAPPASGATVGAGGSAGAGQTSAAIVTAPVGGAVGAGTPPSDASNVTETPSPGGATGGGTSPSARAGTQAGAATGGGTAPSARTAAPVGAAVGAGFAPQPRATTPTGTAVGAGASPTTWAAATPGGCTATGTPPAAAVPCGRGQAGSGWQTPGAATTCGPGAALGGGTSPTAPDHSIVLDIPRGGRVSHRGGVTVRGRGGVRAGGATGVRVTAVPSGTGTKYPDGVTARPAP